MCIRCINFTFANKLNGHETNIIMKVKFQQSLSELREFTSEKDKGFKYLRATFVEEDQAFLVSRGFDAAAQYRINIYPGRDAEGNIDAEQAKSLEDAFNSGALDKEVYYIDRVAVPVAPHYRFYSSGVNKGQLVMDGSTPHLYTTVNITCFMRPQPDGTEVCAADENTLASRARAIQNFRCKNNEWILKEVYDAAFAGTTPPMGEVPDDMAIS